MPGEALELPNSGPLPRPESREQAREVLRREAFPAPDVQLVRLDASEFTAICPRTGQPDFGTLTITYIPADKCVELKSLKFYLQSFRNEGIFYEHVTNTILDDLVAVVEPRRMKLEAAFHARGGMTETVVVEYESESQKKGD